MQVEEQMLQAMLHAQEQFHLYKPTPPTPKPPTEACFLVIIVALQFLRKKLVLKDGLQLSRTVKLPRSGNSMT